MMNKSPRPVLPLRGLLMLMGVPLLLWPLKGAETAPAEPTVVLRGNPGKPPDDVPSTQNEPAPLGGTATRAARTPNDLVLEAVAAMPPDGGYRANTVAVTALRSSLQMRDSRLAINPNLAAPSFCSGATYLVFLSVLDRLQREGRLPLDPATLDALLVQEHQADGVGVWGRWNANGPGTARLFYETGLGRNFTSFDEAMPGDFLKIFWNEEIGSREFGHSVVYLGREQRPEGMFVRYWSSNVPNGFSTREIPLQRIRRVLFSRLERPEQIRRISTIPARDPYLTAMLKRTSSQEEAAQMVGLRELPLNRSAAAPLDPAIGYVPAPEKAPSTLRTVTAPATASPPPTPPHKGILNWFHGHRQATPSPTPSSSSQ